MYKSEGIDELARAIVAAQPSIEKAFKGSDNPFFKSKYADLTEVWKSCEDALKKNKLAILQPMKVTTDGDVIVETVLIHESGQWLSGEVLIKPDKATPQGIGSAITYARRYSLSAMVGVCPEDDDAEAAMNRGKKASEGQPKQLVKKSDLLSEIVENIKALNDPGKSVEENRDIKMKAIKAFFDKATWKEVTIMSNKDLTAGLKLLESHVSKKEEDVRLT